MRFRRSQKKDEPPQRRYADYIAGTDVPPLPPTSRATIRLTVSVDVGAWATIHGMTHEEAHRELGERINDAVTPLLHRLTLDLGDMPILSATASTGFNDKPATP